ncbi:MAG: hydrogenase maturation peptidase HycI [Eggerthellaceae bacterium]|nr:hydrogenase maturation peptidase HycI [Eggerthellaceae bacterium]
MSVENAPIESVPAAVEDAPAAAEDTRPNVVFTVGSVLRGDDAAGPALAKRLEDEPIEGWTVVDGGQTPEDDLGYLRRLKPRRLLLVDAAAMGHEPGEIRLVTADDVATQFLITTHTLPITFLLGELEGICEDVTFLGIQPATTEFFDPLSAPVRRAVDEIYDCLAAGADFARYHPA